MTPDQRLALIAEEREGKDDDLTSIPLDATGTEWCGVWCDRLKAEAALANTLGTVFQDIKACRLTSDVCDIGGIACYVVQVLEQELARAAANEQLGLAAARCGILGAIEGTPVDTTPLALHTRNKLH